VPEVKLAGNNSRRVLLAGTRVNFDIGHEMAAAQFGNANLRRAGYLAVRPGWWSNSADRQGAIVAALLARTTSRDVPT